MRRRKKKLKSRINRPCVGCYLTHGMHFYSKYFILTYILYLYRLQCNLLLFGFHLSILHRYNVLLLINFPLNSRSIYSLIYYKFISTSFLLLVRLGISTIQGKYRAILLQKLQGPGQPIFLAIKKYQLPETSINVLVLGSKKKSQANQQEFIILKIKV